MLMQTQFIRACVLGGLGLVALAGQARAQVNVTTTAIANGTVTRPVYVTAPTGDTSRLFVVEQRYGTPQTGKIRIITLPSNGLLTTPFWTSPNVATGGEQGLLGLAFHPQYNSNGYFWVNYTRQSDGATVIMRGRRSSTNANIADPAQDTTVLIIPQPFNNHNGGWMGFGPDGFLYIGTGDGGSGNDPLENAQNLTSLLGKMLRIDVDGADNIPGNADDDAFPADVERLYSIPSSNPFATSTSAAREIWAYGLRNPWRCAFDRATGELYIADVGQNEREEVNVLPPGNGPHNMGWRCLEGTRLTNLSGCANPPPSVAPVLEYGHSIEVPPTTELGCSITGGYVYRGAAIPCLRGSYFFSDYCTGGIWSFRLGANNQVGSVLDRTAQMDPPGTLAINNVTSFGEDASGEMYVVDQGGNQVFKIIPSSGFTGPDCNQNNQADDCDIALGVVTDANTNGIPDVCEQPTCNDLDFNNDGLFPDDSDLSDFLSVLAGGACSTGDCDTIDFNNDALFPDDADLVAFLRVLAGGSC